MLPKGTLADEVSSAGVLCVSDLGCKEKRVFDSLSERLGGVFDRLKGRGALTEADVRTAMREVRIALLEADVALPVARQFVDQVTEQAVGEKVLRSVTPGQMVIKIVQDELAAMLGSDAVALNLNATPPIASATLLPLGFISEVFIPPSASAPAWRRGSR